MTREITQRRRDEKKRCMAVIRAKSTWGKSKLHITEDLKEIVNRLTKEKGIKPTTARVVVEAIFGNERTGEIGILPAMLMEGRNVDCTPFGVFHHRDMKEKITNDISQPGTMTYTPRSSTIVFKPNRNTTYWPNYEASLRANMPTEPLPPNMHFSQRVQSMSWYKDYQQELTKLCEGKTKD